MIFTIQNQRVNFKSQKVIVQIMNNWNTEKFRIILIAIIRDLMEL